ncbi:hypothetical protein ACC848_41595, partial [Rhizobium johnstonii]
MDWWAVDAVIRCKDQLIALCDVKGFEAKANGESLDLACAESGRSVLRQAVKKAISMQNGVSLSKKLSKQCSRGFT